MSRVVVTVVAPSGRRDLSVPDDTTVGALLPAILEVCAADLSASWTLAPKGGRPLSRDCSLAEGGVLHGSILLLEQVGAGPAQAAGGPSELGHLPVAELRVLSGPSAGRRVPLEPGEHRVGSHRYSRIVLGDLALARVHLVAQVGPAGAVTVAPARSGPVCLVDGERLAGPVRLQPGQVIAAGRSLLAFGRPGEGTTPAGPAVDPCLVLPPLSSADPARFRAQLVELDQALGLARRARLAELTAASPDAAEVLSRLESRPGRFERRPGHPAWLRLRVGWADEPSGLGTVTARHGDPVLRVEAMRVTMRHGTLHGAPVSLSLPDSGPFGIVGDPAAGMALARWLAIQVIALHAPQDVVLAAALPAEARPDFDWLASLPRGGSSPPMLAVGPEEAPRLVRHLTSLIAERQASVATGPAVVAIVHCGVAPAAARALDAGQRVGVHVIWLAADRQRRLHCGTVMELPPGDMAPTLAFRGSEPRLLGGADGLTVELAHRAAAALRALPLDPSSPSQQRVELSDLISAAGDPEHHVLTCWIRDLASSTRQSRRAVIGIDAEGRAVEHDLDRGGRHVLVAGGPATGKSEVLRCAITSLAVRHAPRTLNLLLIGAAAGAFHGLSGLPHLLDLLAGPDEERLQRTLARLDQAPPCLVVAVDELPPPPGRERLLDAFARAPGGGPGGGMHLLVATREPGPVEAAIGARLGLRIAMGQPGGLALAHDAAGRAWQLRPACAATLGRLIEAIAAVNRMLEARSPNMEKPRWT
jgi:DNA segregation ATPase FtsK/SpoIIIE, S-DNA-T family